MNNNAQPDTTALYSDDRLIAGTKSEQLRDLLPLLFNDLSSAPSPLQGLALELIDDVVHAIRRLD